MVIKFSFKRIFAILNRINFSTYKAFPKLKTKFEFLLKIWMRKNKNIPGIVKPAIANSPITMTGNQHKKLVITINAICRPTYQLVFIFLTKTLIKFRKFIAINDLICTIMCFDLSFSVLTSVVSMSTHFTCSWFNCFIHIYITGGNYYKSC